MATQFATPTVEEQQISADRLSSLVNEVKRQEDVKHDIVTKHTNVKINCDESSPILFIETKNERGEIDTERFSISPHTHKQISRLTGIGSPYYMKLLDMAAKTGHWFPAKLLEMNVNAWLGTVLMKLDSEYVTVRTLDQQARAILSDSYRPIDHSEILFPLLKWLSESGRGIFDVETGQYDPGLGDVLVDWATINPEEMRCSFRFTAHAAEIREGDVVQAGIILANNEVGMGAMTVTPRFYRLVCSNGMIGAIPDLIQAHRHVHRGSAKGSGKTNTGGEFIKRLARESVTEILSQFGQIVDRLKESADNGVNFTDVSLRVLVDRVLKGTNLSDKEKNSILAGWGVEKDDTQYGVANAITRAAQKLTDDARREQMEREGARIMFMPVVTFNREYEMVRR